MLRLDFPICFLFPERSDTCPEPWTENRPFCSVWETRTVTYQTQEAGHWRSSQIRGLPWRSLEAWHHPHPGALHPPLPCWLLPQWEGRCHRHTEASVHTSGNSRGHHGPPREGPRSLCSHLPSWRWLPSVGRRHLPPLLGNIFQGTQECSQFYTGAS